MTGPANGFQLSWNIPLVCQERKHQWRLRSERNVKVYRTDFNCLLAIFVHAGANCRDDQAALMILCTLFQKTPSFTYMRNMRYTYRRDCICISFLCPIDD